MRRALLALVVTLAIGPPNDACCDLDAPAAPVRTASDAASCPLHAHDGSGSTTPLPQPKSPVRCAHDLSVDRAGLVKSSTAPAPDLTIAILAAPTAADISRFAAPLPAAAPHAPPRRASRPDALRI